MAIFENFPYVNTHELNLDWIIKKVKDLNISVEDLKSKVDLTEEQIALINDFIENLNIEEIEESIAQLEKELNLTNNQVERILELLLEQDVNPNINYADNYELDNATLQVIYNAMKSYYIQAWSIATQNRISYGNYLTNNITGTSGTPLDIFLSDEVSTVDKLDCSTYVLLCLMGIPFNDTQFNNNSKLKPRTNMATRIKPTLRNPTGFIRWADEILKYAEENGMLYEYRDPKQVRTGDVVFYIWNDDVWENFPEDSFQKLGEGSYRHCAHVGILIDGCNRDTFNNGIALMQCVNTSALTEIRDFESYNPSTQHLYPYIMRPNLKLLGSVRAEGLWFTRATLNRTMADNSVPTFRMSAQAYRYSGNRLPSNYTTNGLDDNTGLEDNTKTGRITTSFIPFTPGMVIDQPLTEAIHEVYYYDSARNFKTKTVGSLNRNITGVAYIRISLKHKTSQTGELTPAMVTYLMSNVVIRYHEEVMTYNSLANSQGVIPLNFYNDVVWYFETDTELIPTDFIGSK